jgi:hypothetical protein
MGDNVVGYFSQMRLIGIKYIREIYDGVTHTYYAILEDDELNDKQRRHILEIATTPGITISILDETAFRSLIDEIAPHLFPDWSYGGPLADGGIVLSYTGEELSVSFDVDMHAAPTLDGWSFSIDGGDAREFESVVRNVGDTTQYDFAIPDPVPEWNETVTISYDCFEGDATSLAGKRLGLLDELEVTNNREEPPTIESATINAAGAVIAVVCSEDMADPSGKHGQFTFTQDGVERAFSAAALEGGDATQINLTVDGDPIPESAVVELAVTASPMYILADGRWGYLRDEDEIAVTNNSLVPTLLSAETSTDGLTIILSFDKDMADPAGEYTAFEYLIDEGAAQNFSAAALDTDITKIVLTCSGTGIAYGDSVTLNYTAGSVESADGGAVTSFVGVEVTNTMSE